ncbi:hypothetical protein BpHYR1_037114, partial [Brachionus plicatilis]
TKCQEVKNGAIYEQRSSLKPVGVTSLLIKINKIAVPFSKLGSPVIKLAVQMPFPSNICRSVPGGQLGGLEV